MRYYFSLSMRSDFFADRKGLRENRGYAGKVKNGNEIFEESQKNEILLRENGRFIREN